MVKRKGGGSRKLSETTVKSQIVNMVEQMTGPSQPKSVATKTKTTRKTGSATSISAVNFPKFIKPPKSNKRNDPLGLAILSNAKHIWLEHCTNHVGSFPPSPYEYDVSYNSENRFLVAVPVFENYSYVPESRRRTGFGLTKTVQAEPPDFACLNAHGHEVCHFSFTTKSAHQTTCLQPRTTEFRMNVYIKDLPMGKVVQYKRSIIVTNANDKEILEVVHAPRTSRTCWAPVPVSFSCPVILRGNSNDPDAVSVIIGFLGRNGPDVKSVVFGKPLGFYFTSEIAPNSIPDYAANYGRAKSPVANLHKVYLLGALVGIMTKYTLLKR